MKTEQIFTGDIRKCTKYERHTSFESKTYINGVCVDCDSFGHIETDDVLYRENAVLIKIQNGGYIDLDTLNSVLDYIKVKKNIKEDGFILGGLILDTSAHCMDSLFVDSESLKPYYNNDKKDNISVRKLRKQVKNSK